MGVGATDTVLNRRTMDTLASLADHPASAYVLLAAAIFMSVRQILLLEQLRAAYHHGKHIRVTLGWHVHLIVTIVLIVATAAAFAQ